MTLTRIAETLSEALKMPICSRVPPAEIGASREELKVVFETPNGTPCPLRLMRTDRAPNRVYVRLDGDGPENQTGWINATQVGVMFCVVSWLESKLDRS